MSAKSNTHKKSPGAILREALITFAICAVLFVPLVGFRTEIETGKLVIDFAIVKALIIAAAVTLVRTLATVFAWQDSPLRLTMPAGVGGPLAKTPFYLSRQSLSATLLIAALLLPVLVMGPSQRYYLGVGTQILIYVMLGWGLNIVVGLAGLLDLGYVAFYAVGAYTYAKIATEFGWSFWVCLPLAGLLAAAWGVTLGFPVLRLRGDYLAIVTLAFGEIIRVVLNNWQSFTGGPNGINIPRIDFFGLPFERSGDATFHKFFGIGFDSIHRIVFLYYVILFLALLTNFVTLRLRRLPIGRAWEALREDEIACRSLGINTVSAKLSAFAIGAMFGGFAGSFFAARQGFISPESFTFGESALILAIVVLGGLGSQIGVVLAAVALVGSDEIFRDLQEFRRLIFGAAMVFMMTWRPRGFLSQRSPSAFLVEERRIAAAHVKEGHG